MSKRVKNAVKTWNEYIAQKSLEIVKENPIREGTEHRQIESQRHQTRCKAKCT